MKVLLDVTRTLIRRYHPSPTGIDRVEFEYVRRLLDAEHYPDVGFVAITPCGNALLNREEMRRIFNEVRQRQSGVDATGKAYHDLSSLLERSVDPAQTHIQRLQNRSHRSNHLAAYARLAEHWWRSALRFRRTLREVSETGALYIHTSHQWLFYPAFFRWTASPGVRAAFMIHDLIPIEYPEFCSQQSTLRHPWRLRNAMERGSVIIVNSRHTAAVLDRYVHRVGLPSRPVVVGHLGSKVEVRSEVPPPPRAAAPYFVCLGTIEGRKNLSFLLNVWRQMLADGGPENAPRLVIAGKRGWQSREVLEALDRSVELAPNVVEVAGLGDAEVAALIDGSHGVLAPSLCEGFGLSTVEGISRGVPVIASDIPAHREILADYAMLLDPTDGRGWITAIRALMRDQTARRDGIARIAAFPQITWTEHVDRTIAEAIRASA